MSAKKTTKRKNNKKKSARTKSPGKAAKKTAAKKKVVTQKKATRLAKKRSAPAKKTSARAASRKKQPPVNPEREIKQEFRRSLTSTRAASGRQSGDLQGLSRTARADSESVDELVEEGNLFEAGAVAGVQEADDSDEKEVHTHEVPEDDVPEEYLDEQ
jgi:hypothetical protein